MRDYEMPGLYKPIAKSSPQVLQAAFDVNL